MGGNFRVRVERFNCPANDRDHYLLRVNSDRGEETGEEPQSNHELPDKQAALFCDGLISRQVPDLPVFQIHCFLRK